MASPLPLLDAMELAEIKRQRETLRRKLGLSGAPARTRIRREQELAKLTALQVRIERNLGMERKP